MHPPRSTTLRRLADLARPEAATLAAATVALLLGSGLNLAYPQAVRWMIDAITALRALQRPGQAQPAPTTPEAPAAPAPPAL